VLIGASVLKGEGKTVERAATLDVATFISGSEVIGMRNVGRGVVRDRVGADLAQRRPGSGVVGAGAVGKSAEPAVRSGG
jgi:hypothetical protein